MFMAPSPLGGSGLEFRLGNTASSAPFEHRRPEPLEAQRVAQHENAAGSHGGGGQDRRKEDAEGWVEHARGYGDEDDVVDEGPVPPTIARWLWRWTTPIADYDEMVVRVDNALDGTRVIVF